MNTLSILDAESSNIPEGLYLKLVNALKSDFDNNKSSDSDSDSYSESHSESESDDDEPISYDVSEFVDISLSDSILFRGVYDKWDVFERLHYSMFANARDKESYLQILDEMFNRLIWIGDELMCKNINCKPFDKLYYNIIENYDNIEYAYHDFIFNNNIKECKFICAGGCPTGNYFCPKTYKYFCWSHLKRSYEYIDRPNLIRTNCCGFNLRQEACSVIGTELAHNNKMYCWRHIVDA